MYEALGMAAGADIECGRDIDDGLFCGGGGESGGVGGNSGTMSVKQVATKSHTCAAWYLPA